MNLREAYKIPKSLGRKAETPYENKHFRTTNTAFSNYIKDTGQKSNIEILKKEGLPSKSNKLFQQWKEELEKFTDCRSLFERIKRFKPTKPIDVFSKRIKKDK